MLCDGFQNGERVGRVVRINQVVAWGTVNDLTMHIRASHLSISLATQNEDVINFNKSRSTKGKKRYDCVTGTAGYNWAG